jgi:Na+-transporting methylmalonyl-CoA/oxaloacetate decarboxylase gamma subunit
MPENIILSLQITVIGMGLVFGAILLLWAVMDLLMRLTNRARCPTQAEIDAGPKAAARAAASSAGSSLEGSSKEGSTLKERQRRAAAAAVALALARQKSGSVHEFPLPQTSLVSAWQAVMRSKNLSRRGRVR